MMSMIALSTLLLLARLRLVLAPLGGGGVFTGHHRLRGGVTGSTIGAGLGGAAGSAVGNNLGNDGGDNRSPGKQHGHRKNKHHR
jgi:hypothetical protein